MQVYVNGIWFPITAIMCKKVADSGHRYAFQPDTWQYWCELLMLHS